MAGVTKLTIAGFKSIRELRDLELRNLNVLIGANGSGKSNFIGLFRMLAEMYEERLQLYVQTQGGPDALLHFSRKTTDEIHAELRFGDRDRYEFKLVPTNDNRLILSDEQFKFQDEGHDVGGKLGDTPESRLQVIAEQHGHPYIAAALEGTRVYHFHDTGEKAKVKQLHALNDTLRLKVDGANLAAYLCMLKAEHAHNYRLIVDTIRLAAPFFDDFVFRTRPSSKIQLEWTERGDPDTPFTAHALSDGTLRFICLCTLLLQPWELMPATILIDEPELGLHPYAINLLAELLKRASERNQLIVSTQSVELLDNMDPEDVIVVDRKDNASTFHRLDATQLQDWLDDYSLGDLWKQNVLGGRPA
ncbi:MULTISPECIES: AAA family ATPase [Paraburkholderia]|uniref:AAA family ATPase n=2 Tax=Paraburkholderia TaxID=1822464 RepID=A0ABW9DAX3_9BURK|nr:AAA family ATPase [Paraburkholderia bryophila]NYH18118.1 putative ATPase [Paraburkholderia bryophila]NYH22782.1 putative ATPase [Paraburkholderia bryophila]